MDLTSLQAMCLFRRKQLSLMQPESAKAGLRASPSRQRKNTHSAAAAAQKESHFATALIRGPGLMAPKLRTAPPIAIRPKPLTVPFLHSSMREAFAHPGGFATQKAKFGTKSPARTIPR